MTTPRANIFGPKTLFTWRLTRLRKPTYHSQGINNYASLKIITNLDIYFHSCSTEFLYRRQHSKWKINTLCYSIPTGYKMTQLKERMITSINPKISNYLYCSNNKQTIQKRKSQAYFISSNSPSGGTKLTVFSELNLVKFTHWWNVTSSSSIVLPLQKHSTVIEENTKTNI